MARQVVRMRVLDLFSGIGGFSLGLERAGMRTVQFVELDPFCRAVLAQHWPDVPCHDDVRTLQAGPGSADVITAGFPCQNVSILGDRAGLAGESSGLWSEVARVVRDVRPRYLILENVPSLCVRGLGDVLRDLAAIGYDAEWEGIPAAAVGAPHLRARQWVVAYPASERDGLQAGSVFSGWADPEPRRWWASEPDVVRVAHGVPGRVDRLRSLGNAVVPQIPEIIGRALMRATGSDAGSLK